MFLRRCASLSSSRLWVILISTLVLAAAPPPSASQASGLDFASAVAYGSGGNNVTSVAVADVNGDGKPDIIVANGCASSSNCNNGAVGVLLGNGDGTFQAAVTYGSGGDDVTSVAVIDVNGDGKPDIIVANECGNTSNCNNGTVGVLLGNGDGTFQAAVTYGSGGWGATSVAVGDVNEDGKPDIVVANACASSSDNSVDDCTGELGVLLGNGDGTFQAAVTYGSGGDDVLSVAVADVNGDSKPDVVVANYCASTSNCNNGTVGVLLGNGDGTFQAAVTYGSGGGANSVAVADVNGDGKPDVLVSNQLVSGSNSNNGTVGVLLGNGDGTFQAAVSYNSGGLDAISVATGDVNGDGKPDVVVANECSNCNNGTVGVLLGNGDGTFQAAVTYGSGGNEPESVAVMDVNGDGKPDLVLANNCASFGNCTYGAVGVLINTSLTPTTTVLVSTSPSYVGQPVTFTATVTPQPSSYKSPPPNGELVTFKDVTASPAVVLGAAPLTGGIASFVTSSLVKGNHTIKAKYSGDGNLLASLATIAEVVQRYPTVTTLTSSQNPSSTGQPVTFSATVTSSGPTPTGTITFYKGKVVIGTALLNSNGVAQFTTSTLPVGTHPMTASYAHDTYNAGSVSAVVDQTVN